MSKITCVLVLAMALFMSACDSNGPAGALDKAAKALDENNGAAFLAQIDMPLYTENYIHGIIRNDTALSSLDKLGDMLGLGSLDKLGDMLGLGSLNNLIGSIVDFRAHIERQFAEGVASGELMAQCKTATTPDCPWYPSSLREAQIVEVGTNAAIAKVTTPARLTSWIALCREGENWRIAGIAVMENTAREMALKGAQKQAAPANSGKPVNI